MSLAPGATLGRYQILEPLGQGGMATVYKANQPALQRIVALKVIRAGFAEDPEFVERFQREALAIAKLQHPAIVQVYDFDQFEKHWFLAMQYLEGGTLKDRLTALAARGERLPRIDTARIVSQVAEALEYAHKRGIVHRDIKPANVMLTEDERAVVTDFGIAKILSGTQHTQAGVGIGTPEYMSPEQGQGIAIDHRADIYALAVTAYEMLTGQLPFTADTPIAVVLKHIKDPLPLPSAVDAALGGATEQVLLKALAKDPNDRYASAPEFAQALTAAVHGGPVTAKTMFVGGAAPTLVVTTPARSGGGLPLPLPVIGGAAAAVLVLAAAGAMASGVFSTRATPTPTPFVAAATAPPTAAATSTLAPSAVASAATTAAPASVATAVTQAPATPAPVAAPTQAPAAPPPGSAALSLDKSTISQSRGEPVAVTARGFPKGTVLKWVSMTAQQGGYMIPMGQSWSTSSDPYSFSVPWGGPLGTYVLHWEVGSAKYDLTITVAP